MREQKLLFILGPCVIESEDHAVRMAAMINRICHKLSIGNSPDSRYSWIFKASFDKANRSSHDSYRGPKLNRGLEILRAVKDETSVRICSDIHEPSQAEAAAEILDVIQIPALLSRQTDLLFAAARAGKPINLKKGQFMAPEDIRFAVEKIRLWSCEEIYLTERGSCFGYHNLVVDMRSIPIMKRLGLPVLIDASHSVQLPGGSRSSGESQFIGPIAAAAIAAGADGAFIEVHDDPAAAKSDGPNSLDLANLESLLSRLCRIFESLE